ncbi:MAG: acylneuraminate cytidylyltransferase [Polyangiaceae bacterium]|nr:acylneuraminate cytidylyltransferase [Polyangiaceae bacterium]
MKPECLAIIPARGGSKGLPRKNTRPLGGVPLVGRSVQVARGAAAVTRVVVSTDDPEVANIAQRYGAEVVWRPTTLANETASSEDALLHVLGQLADQEGYHPDLVVMLQCTSPLTSSDDVDRAVNLLVTARAGSCFTAVPFFHFLWRTRPDGTAEGINHSGSKRARRQDLAPQLLENGAVYVMRTDALLASRDRFCGKVVACEVSAARLLEVDDARDFAIAEALVRVELNEGAREHLPRPVQAVVFDFDGVMTDDRVHLTEDGTESVVCHRSDGHGVALLRELGTPMLILSREQNSIVTRRASKLGIECIQGVEDKLAVLRAWTARRGVAAERMVYVGNDVTDVECMLYAGCSACPSDAGREARAAARIVLRARGGDGAVRELCELVLEAGRPKPPSESQA